MTSSSLAVEQSLPHWLERPGASEAVVVGADLRSRYGALKSESGTKCDEVEMRIFMFQ